MKYLLDTRVLLWALNEPERLSNAARRALADPAQCHVSAVVLFEIALKRPTGKITAPDDLPERLAELGLKSLPVTPAHAWAVSRLPAREDHKDPFDRLLVAQAMSEAMVLVTHDQAMLDYEVETLKA